MEVKPIGDKIIGRLNCPLSSKSRLRSILPLSPQSAPLLSLRDIFPVSSGKSTPKEEAVAARLRFVLVRVTKTGDVLLRKVILPSAVILPVSKLRCNRRGRHAEELLKMPTFLRKGRPEKRIRFVKRTRFKTRRSSKQIFN